MKRARVPVEQQVTMSKSDIVMVEIDWAAAAGVRFECLLADAGYGLGPTFGQALDERGPSRAVGLAS